jgi:hypothetical protein
MNGLDRSVGYNMASNNQSNFFIYEQEEFETVYGYG